MVVSVRTPLHADGSRIDFYRFEEPLPNYAGEFDFSGESETKAKTRTRKAKIVKKPASPPPPPERLLLGKVVSR